MQKKQRLPDRLRYYTVQYFPKDPEVNVWSVQCVECPDAFGGSRTPELAEKNGVDNLLALIHFRKKDGYVGGVPIGRATPHNNMPEGYFEVCIDVANERAVSFSRHVPHFHKVSGFD